MTNRIAAILVAASLLGCAGPPADEPSSASEALPSAAAPETGNESEPGESASPGAPAGTPAGTPAGSPTAAGNEAQAAPAPKVESPPLTDREREVGRTFQPLANEFGLTRYVHAARTRSGRGILFEYLPEEESLDESTYLGTMILTRFGSTWEVGVEALPRYVAAFTGQMRQVNENIVWPFKEGAVHFVDYEVGQGPLREHNLAVVWQVFPGHIAVFQVQRRPERFSAWQIDHFRSVAQRLGRADAGSAEGGASAGGAPESTAPAE